MIAAALLALAPAQVPGEQAIAEGVAWLVRNQNEDGSWGGHQTGRPYEVLCDVPGSHQAFRVATSALCVMALEQSPHQTASSRQAAGRGLDYLLAAHDVKRPNDIEHYNVWAFGYGLQCLAEHLAAAPGDPRAGRMREVCQVFLERLARYQCLDGGWGYLSLDDPATQPPSFTSMSFTTATCLIGMERARRIGLALPQPTLDKALRSVERCLLPNGSFTYGEYWRRSPLMGVNRPVGAACRIPVCLEALALFGDAGGEDAARSALHGLLADYSGFQKAGVRRPIPHESHYQISGYFYLYGHAYAALLLQRLPAADQRRYAPLLNKAVLAYREPDGAFWDYPLYDYHKPYGTAFALLALAKTHSMAEQAPG